jgi:hypothetical protein
MPPEGIDISDEHVWKLKKSLYGLNQATRLWNDKLHAILNQMDFSRSLSDPSLYIKTDGTAITVHIDGLLGAGKSEKELDEIERLFGTKCELKKIRQAKNAAVLRT